MSNIIPFDDNSSARLPAYLKKVDVAALNADLTSHAGAGFPQISIKGKVFTEVRDGERKIIPNPKDPESPATYIEVVLIKVNKHKSKVWYASGFQEGQESKKPDCYSKDGVTPAGDVDKPQAKSCSACKFNEFGSRLSETGRKGKACADSVRVAIAKPDLLNDPYLLRVPAASMRGLGEFGQVLAKRGVGYQMVVTRIAFDQAEATPKLTFKPVGFLDEAAFNKVQEMVDSDIVKNILASESGWTEERSAPAQEPVEKPVPQEQAAKAADVAISKAKTVSVDEVVGTINKATKGAANVSGGDLGELDLGSLKFDD